MNLKTNYESLLKAKSDVQKLQKSGNFDAITNAKLNNIANRIELTLIDLRIKLEEE